ncbi:MAG: carboxypeptidase-like regulatory domain-containing protein [Terracidiphilus sp.]
MVTASNSAFLRRLPILAPMLAFAALPTLAQTPANAPTHSAPSATGLYSIAGTVVNAASGDPLRHATIAALSEEDSHTVAAVESDSEGHFSVERLPAAKYQLTASKRGYRTAFFDEHDDFNSAIVTGPGLETGNLTFRLIPGGVLHGVVTAESGEPVENARVMLFMKWRDGKPGGRIGQENTVTTDDTGAYEFNNLAAGEYLLAVTAEPWYALHHSSRLSPNAARTAARSADSEGPADPSTALDVAYPVTYYDSTTDEASATRIVLAGGSREEANITLHAAPALHITVDTPRKQDGSIARAELRQTVFGHVVGAESAGFLDAMLTGTTEFNGVAPGHYELSQGDPPRILEFDAAASQQVDPALGSSTVSVHGTLRTTSGAPWTDVANVSLESMDTSHRESSMHAGYIRGTFDFPSVPPGQWQLIADSAGRQLPVVSVSVGGRTNAGNLITVQDRPLSIVAAVSQGMTRIEGFARRDNKGVAGVMVVLVPAAKTFADLSALNGLFRRDQSDSDGSFALRDVVPGQYILVAIEDGWPLDWAEPNVIARYLPGGLAVTVSDKPGKLVTLSDPVPVQTR